MRPALGHAGGLVEGQQGELAVGAVAERGCRPSAQVVLAVGPAAFAIDGTFPDLRLFEPDDVIADEDLIALGFLRAAEHHGLQRDHVSGLGAELADVARALRDALRFRSRPR